MTKSIDFVYPLNDAKEKIFTVFNTHAINIIKEEIMQNGIKFHCADGARIILFLSKGNSSKLYLEKSTNATESVFNQIQEEMQTNKGHIGEKLVLNTIKEIPTFPTHIGTDESGKGDYFGPLVIAGVFVTAEDEKRLLEIGVRDSKNNSDSHNMELARQILELLDENKVSIVFIRPERYNTLYVEMGKNLNRTLAWGHARVIENILIHHDCSNVIADQFGDESFIRTALMKKGKKIELLQTPKAERDIAVAAASILARAKFLSELTSLSKTLDEDIQLPKGASPAVEEIARKIVAKKGKESLKSFAKIHFKTTEKI